DRFSQLYRILTERGLDPTEDLLPIIPAQHSIMGGIYANLSGETSCPRLFAVGEVAWTGVHGINRLASNGLLEAGIMAMLASEALFPYLRQKDELNAETNIFRMAQEMLSLLSEKEKAELIKPRDNWLPDHTLLEIIFQHTAQYITPLSPSERPIIVSSVQTKDNHASLEEALQRLTTLLAQTPRLSPEWLALKTTVVMLKHRQNRMHRFHLNQTQSYTSIDDPLKNTL
ncbi:MAG: FAD-binding protein, partial [Candidatus Carbobacillus sp.]|nr:FAD-binding protein [Candidatus Carbobacillus sp.]